MGISTVPPDRPLIIWEPSTTPPAGYIKANGAVISRTVYAWLFGRIGTTFGVGDGSTTFSLPDLRGEFLRGLDDGRGVDSGRGIGSFQNHDFLSHVHTECVVTSTAGGELGVLGTGTGSGNQNTTVPNTTGWQGGAETRPRNIAGLYCIAYAP